MLRLLCRSATFVLMISIGNKAFEIDPENYVPFLSDIQEYYKSSGVFLLYDEHSEGFATQSNIVAFLHYFSSRNILSQAIRYSKMRERSDFHLSYNTQSLFVVFLTSQANLENFSAVTEAQDMSYHTWLVVFTEFVNAEVDALCRSPEGNPFHLVFNSRMIVQCYGDEEIKKWYSLQDNRTEVLELAKWSRSLGIAYKNKNYYESRYDLSGKSIRIATNTKEVSRLNGKMMGFFEEILEELRNFMNFTVVRAREEDAYGKWEPERGKWSGLIGLLTEREVDIVITPLTISKFRLDVIDFTRPILLSRNRIYVRQPGGARIQWSAYFKAFSIASWSIIAVLLVGTSLLTTFIRAVINQSEYLRLSMNYILENFIRIWGIYCQQGVPEFPSASSLRLAYFTMLLLTLVIWAIYSASITSYLTVLTPSLPFTDTEGFVRDGTYRLIVLQNSSDQNLILSGLDPVLSKLEPLLKNSEDLPTNPFAGFQQVCEGKVGFYASQAALDGVSSYIPCTLTYIETGQFECLAMGLAKRSPYITSTNYNLRKLEDTGVMKKLKNWYFRKLNAEIEAGHSPIGIRGVAPLIAIFTSGFVLSLLILCLENLLFSIDQSTSYK